MNATTCAHCDGTGRAVSRTSDQMRILFYALNSPVTPLIRIVTGDHHTHVAIAFKGRLFEALYNGVRRLEGGAAIERAGEADTFVDLTISPACGEHLQQWLDGQVGRQYDFGQMLSMWLASFSRLRLVFGPAGAWTCSGLVATVLEFAGVLVTPEPRLVTPGSLYRMLFQREPSPAAHAAGRLAALPARMAVQAPCPKEESTPHIPNTLFKQQVEPGNVVEIASRGDKIQGTFRQALTVPSPGADRRA